MSTTNIGTIADGARRLKRHLKEKGIELSHGQALSALSAALGERDWKTLRAALSAIPAPEPERYYEMYKALPNIGVCEFTLFAPVFATADYAESPAWMMVTINAQLLQQIAELAFVVGTKHLGEAAVDDAVFWENWETYSLIDDRMVVSANSVYWTADMKHAGGTIESKGMSFEDLGELLNEGLARGKEVLFWGMDPLEGEALETALREYNA